jgi:hypothetical protein
MRWCLGLLSILGLCLLPLSVEAQCPNPDLLDGGPCCAQATPNIPPFPNFRSDALEICWRNCGIDSVLGYRAVFKNITVAPSVGIPCGERLLAVELFDTLGALRWTGALRLQYARTWLETGPAGFPLQVWRFLANGDLRPVLPLLQPCPVPPCAPAFNNRVRFTGYVDYAGSCNLIPTQYQHAWMLTHACDFIDHHPGFARAGAFHPDRSYTFVGPALGFVPDPAVATEGTPGSPFEAMHKRVFPPLGTALPVTCNFEDRLNFSLTPQQMLCLCTSMGAVPQFFLGTLNLQGACGDTVMSNGPFLPGYLSIGIGTWTAAGTYPGIETLRWNVSGTLDVDACTLTTSQEVYYGVTTIAGYPANQITAGGVGGALPLTFIDQGNSRRPSSGTGTIMNTPYVSTTILNLNH